MKVSETASSLKKLLSFSELEGYARATGALQRERKLHPVEMLEAMLAAQGDPAGRLSGALHYLRWRKGVRVNRSSFYQRLNQSYAAFVKQVCERVLEGRLATEQPALRGRLAALRDLWAYDATTIRLRQRLASVFSSGGSDPKAGVKLHAGVSLRSGTVVRPRVTEERVADVRGIDLGGALDDVLVLLDRGYSSYALLDRIALQGGFFLTRLKDSHNPQVRAIVAAGGGSGTLGANAQLNDTLEQGALGFDGPVDVEVELYTPKTATRRVARVVGVPTERNGSTETWWFLTNLSRDDYPPDLIAQLYTLRWQIELLWKQLKQSFRLDDIEALTEHNVRMLMDVSVLAYLLTLGVMDAVTTPAERKSLSIGQLARAVHFLVPRLTAFLHASDDRERQSIAQEIRTKVLLDAKDTHPKRTRQQLKRRLQNARISPISKALSL